MLTRTAYKMKPPVSARIVPGHPLADKLIACYLMNEGSGLTVFDSSGRGHHGTLTGGATWVMGKYGPAVDLDGTDGHIVIPDHDDFSPVLSPFSISARVNMHEAVNFQVSSKGIYNVSAEWRFFASPTRLLRARVFDEDVDDCYIGREYNVSLAVYEGTMVDVAWTYSGGTSSDRVSLYLQGSKVDNNSSSSNSGSFDSSRNLTHDIHIGRDGTTYSNGVFDYEMMWRRVLTPSDIRKLCVDPFCMFARSSRLLVTI